jgi:predicted dehydrogenase
VIEAIVRIAFVGVNHWHFKGFLGDFQAVPGVKVVGVSDPDAAVAKRVGEELGCAWSADYRQLCREVKPDFVLALGRHCDMAAEAGFLIDEGIPFAMDKPGGMNHAEVAATAEKAARKGAFAAVALVMRQGELLECLRVHARDEAYDYMSFRYHAHRTSHFEKAGCPWALDPAQAGGGVLLGLGVHYLDLFALLAEGRQVRVVSATVSNRAEGRGVDDYAQVTLEAGGTLGLVQVGYLKPGKSDRHYCIRTAGHYFMVGADKSVDVTEFEGGTTNTVPFDSDRSAARKVFAADVLVRMRSGTPPVADMSHMAAAMGLAQEAYRIATPSLIPAGRA